MESFAVSGIMRPFLVANMVNRDSSVRCLICAPRFGIAFVWLAVPGWLACELFISYVALRRSWPTDKIASTGNFSLPNSQRKSCAAKTKNSFLKKSERIYIENPPKSYDFGGFLVEII